MPYGIAKEAGGDSPGNIAKVERCVQQNMKRGMSKQQAIRVCKASVQGTTKRRGRRS